ncbi:MAG TPA: hypothetical protein VIK52_14060 [Opitutaceae bacterium]
MSPAAIGIVALVGTAEGGKPLTIEEAFADATRASRLQSRYRSGDLRTAGAFVFEPSADPAVPGGASKVIAVKVNPAAQAGLSLPDGNGADSLDVTSKDWGLRQNQISVEVAAGTNKGLKYTITLEDVTEVFDDVGGDSLFDAIYDPGADGYDTMLASIDSTKFLARATKAEAGLLAQRTNDIPAPGVVNVASSNAADTTQTVTVYGLSALNAPIQETIALNGVTPVQGLTSFASVLAVRLSAVALGTVTVSDFPVTTTLFTLLTTVLTRGIVDPTNTPANGVLTVSIDVDTAVDVVVRGTNAAGAAVAERFDMTAGNTTPVVGTAVFASITSILLGDVAGARTITVAVDAVKTLHTEFPTVARVVDRLNALDGFTANANVSNYTTFLMTDADYHAAPTRAAVSLLTPAKDFYADLFFGAKALTDRSAYVNGARATGGGLPPASTVGALFLIGGSEGVTTIAEWQQAFRLLEKRRYNILVPLSRDPAIHSLALTHMLRKNGVLKSESNAYVGIGTADGAGETRTNIQAQIQALGTRHFCAISQEVQRSDPDTGLATFYPPHIFAAIAAGMQAGSPIAEPLTRKTMIATDIRNDDSWVVEEDTSDLIDRGLMIAEKVDGVGIRWVRSITTHLADDNLAFVEMSANESVNTGVFRLRNALEKRVGGRGLTSAVGSILTLAQEELDRLVDEEIIGAWRALQVEQVGDVFPVALEMSPIGPINFIPITIHLALPTAQAAA